MELKLATEILDGGIFVLVVDGEIDLYTAPEFERSWCLGLKTGRQACWSI